MKKIKYIPLSDKAYEKEVSKVLGKHIRFVGWLDPKFKGCDHQSAGGGN